MPGPPEKKARLAMALDILQEGILHGLPEQQPDDHRPSEQQPDDRRPCGPWTLPNDMDGGGEDGGEGEEVEEQGTGGAGEDGGCGEEEEEGDEDEESEDDDDEEEEEEVGGRGRGMRSVGPSLSLATKNWRQLLYNRDMEVERRARAAGVWSSFSSSLEEEEEEEEEEAFDPDPEEEEGGHGPLLSAYIAEEEAEKEEEEKARLVVAAWEEEDVGGEGKNMGNLASGQCAPGPMPIIPEEQVAAVEGQEEEEVLPLEEDAS